MDLPTSPSLWKRVGLWFWNLLLMPGRVAELHAGRRHSESRAKFCPQCDGRMNVIHTRTLEKNHGDLWRYECKPCSVNFWWTFKA